MGLSSSSSKTNSTSNSTSTATPLPTYQPAVDQGVSAAQAALGATNGLWAGQQGQNIYNSLAAPQTALGNIYSGSTPSQATMTHLQSAGANDPSMGALQGSITASMANPALASLQGMTGGGPNGDTSQYYQDVIGGKYLTNNPYIDGIAQQATDAATKAQNQRFALSGMDAGMSTPFSQALGTAVANANNQVRYQNYNDERQLQNTAAGMSDAEYNATKDRNLSAATNLGSIYNQGVQNRTAAANALGSQYTNDNNTALAAANGMTTSQLNAAIASGQISQDQLNALGATQALPYASLLNYTNIVNGLTGKYGTNTGNSTSSGTTTTNQSLGAGLGGILGAGLAGWASGGFKGA